MDVRKTALEKAFELARSGKCLTVTDLLQRLKLEGYDESQIVGPALRKQLLQIIKEPRP